MFSCFVKRLFSHQFLYRLSIAVGLKKIWLQKVIQPWSLLLVAISIILKTWVFLRNGRRKDSTLMWQFYLYHCHLEAKSTTKEGLLKLFPKDINKRRQALNLGLHFQWSIAAILFTASLRLCAQCSIHELYIVHGLYWVLPCEIRKAIPKAWNMVKCMRIYTVLTIWYFFLYSPFLLQVK